MDRALAPLRLLVLALAAALVVSLAALPAAQARAGVETDTWLDIADDEPALGDTIEITAYVEQAEDPDAGVVPGQVSFGAGTTEDEAYDAPTSLGQVALVDGAAVLSYTLTEASLPPGTADSFYVVARYVGTDAFAESVSEAVRIEITPTDPTDPVPTTITLTAPDVVNWEEEFTVTAAVEPADATGTVTFEVTPETEDGASVEVQDGTASVSFFFSDWSDQTVTARFEPNDDRYLASTSEPRIIAVTNSPAPPLTIWNPTFSFGHSCRPAAAPAAVIPFPSPFTYTMDFTFPTFTPLIGILAPFLNFFSSFEFEACIAGIGVYFGHRAENTVPVDCDGTETGYQCRFVLPGPIATMTGEPHLPVPAELAGQTIDVQSTLTQVDPDGVVSTVYDETSSVDVPARTVLRTELAPVKSGVTSVQRGKTVAYRLSAQNAGIVTADKVRACVSVSKGAVIKTAKGATVKGRQACWTLPSLKSLKKLARTLTVVAPKKAGELKLTAVVTPKASQADPVTVTRVLPVR